MSEIVIRVANDAEIEAVREIERDAAERFAEVGYAEIARLPVQTREQLSTDCLAGRLFVAVDSETVSTPLLVGFAVFEEHGSDVHLRELDVRRDAAGRGIGRRLIEAVADWGSSRGLLRLTLTTYRDIPFNAPYYARLGFHAIPEEALGERLRELRAFERSAGVELAPRLAMALPLRRDSPSNVISN